MFIKQKTILVIYRHSKKQTKILKNWILKHLGNSYPSTSEKMELSESTGLSFLQIDYWFYNSRKTKWFKRALNDYHWNNNNNNAVIYTYNSY